MVPSLDADVGIIGGGPAGSALAAYLARAGVSVRLFEASQFPRPHVGESLVPAANRVLRELGLIEAMEAAGFPRKYGAVWRAHGSRHTYDHDWQGVSTDCDASLRFAERPWDGVERPYTFHVDRARFDHMLLKHAESLGAEVHMPAPPQTAASPQHRMSASTLVAAPPAHTPPLPLPPLTPHEV